MKTILSLATLILTLGSAYGMVGGPLFTLGHGVTAMSVEAGQVSTELSSPGIGGTHELGVSERFWLAGRYGMFPGIDLSARAGAANLRFSELSAGYSSYASDWSVAWGCGVRAGYPQFPREYQAVATLNYTGYRPEGHASNGLKTVESTYLWHEIVPALGAGYKVGPVIPYVALSKPFIFGRREATVTFRGQEFAAAAEADGFRDTQQPLRGTLGLEWRLPEGYSIGAEATTTTDGHWTLHLALSQVMR